MMTCHEISWNSILVCLVLEAQRAALNQYDELLKRVADRDPNATQEARCFFFFFCACISSTYIITISYIMYIYIYGIPI